MAATAPAARPPDSDFLWGSLGNSCFSTKLQCGLWLLCYPYLPISSVDLGPKCFLGAALTVSWRSVYLPQGTSSTSLGLDLSLQCFSASGVSFTPISSLPTLSSAFTPNGGKRSKFNMGREGRLNRIRGILHPVMCLFLSRCLIWKPSLMCEHETDIKLVYAEL